MRLSTLLAAIVPAFALIFVPGCPTKDNKNGGGPIPIEQVADEVAGAICDVAVTCFGGVLGDSTQCRASFVADFKNGQEAQWKAAIDRGTLTYDGAKMRECIDALKAGGCDAFNSEQTPAACDEAFAGSVAIDAACNIDDECAGVAYCDTYVACPGVCTAYLGQGDDCSGQGICGQGLDCVGDVCSPMATAGQPCEAGVAPSCSGTLDCQGADWGTGAPGTCVAPPQVTTVGVGVACAPDTNIFCESGLSCVIDSIDPATEATVWLCAAASTAGGSCKMGIPDPCPSDQFCNGVVFPSTFEGTCAALPTEGQACADVQMGEGCGAGLGCDWNTNVCTRMHNLGEACTNDDACVSGFCDVATSVCAIPKCD